MVATVKKKPTTAPKLLKAIWAAGYGAGLTEEMIRDVVFVASGQRSLRCLSYTQACEVLTRIGRSPSKYKKKKKTRDYPERRKAMKVNRYVIKLASKQETDLIDWFLMERLDLDGKDPKIYLATMCRRLFHRDYPRTSGEAGRVIGNLRKQAERQAAAGKISRYAKYKGTK